MIPGVRQIVLTKVRGLNRWRAARARGNPKLLMVGDSTTVGVGSMGSLHTNNRAGATPTHLSVILNMMGIAARCDWWIGDGNSGSNLAAAETRIALGLLTTVDTVIGLGGAYLINSASTLTNIFDWTTTVSCDQVEFMSLKNTTPRSFNVYSDDVLQSNVSLVNASTAFFIGTVALPAAQTPGVARKISPRRVAGAIRINGLRPFLANGNEIQIGNAGRGSVTANTLANTAAISGVPSLPDSISNAAPDLTIIEIGLNDMVAGRTPTQFKADVQVLVTSAKVTGDVILCAPHPLDETTPYTYSSASYRGVLLELVNENGLPPLVNFFTQFGSFVALNARSGYFDGTHLLSFINREKALTLAPIILH